MNRRDLLRTGGAVAASLTIAGCTGEGAGNGDNKSNADKGDDEIIPSDPGWFDIEGGIYSEKNAKNLKVTEHHLFRTPDGFGVRGTVKNTGSQPYTSVTVHARLLDKNDEVIDSWKNDWGEQEATDDLASGEKWQFDIFFEDTNPSDAFNENVRYQVWATGEAK